MPRWPWRRTSASDPLGTGLWRRCYADCATAARASPALDPLLAQVRAMAEANHTRWPSDSLDVPSDSAGRAAYEHLRQVQMAFRESAYRARMAAVATCPDDRLRQQVLGQTAVAEAVRRLGSDI
ncbi:MAG: hypothetical protein WCA29_10415 [Jiangellales bacterium]